jgi:DNA repair protein RadC
LAHGATSLSDAELVAIFLHTGFTGKSAVDLSRDLLNEFGSLRSLLMTDKVKFCAAKCLGKAKYVQLLAALEIARRHLFESARRGDALSKPTDTRNYLAMKLREHPFEVCAALFLDHRHRVIEFKTLFRALSTAPVCTREVVRRALDYNAAVVIAYASRASWNRSLKRPGSSR